MQLSQSHKLLSPASGRQMVQVHELDMLESVDDDYTDADNSKCVSQSVSRPPSALPLQRIDPAPAAPALRESAKKMPYEQMLQGRTLLQKVQYAGMPQKTWQMDAETG